MPDTATAPEILTAEEAVEYLRMDKDHAALADSIASLHRLVRKFGLRPVANVRPYRFMREELRRWCRSQTDQFTPHRITDPKANGTGDTAINEITATGHKAGHKGA